MLRYKLYQNKNPKSLVYGLWFARSVCEETVDTAGLAEHMAKHNTPYSKGTINGILKDMTACIKELLLDGKCVKLDDLAIFSVGIQCKGAASAELFTATANVTGVRLRARATGTLSTTTLKQEVKVREFSQYVSAASSTGGTTTPDTTVPDTGDSGTGGSGTGGSGTGSGEDGDNPIG